MDATAHKPLSADIGIPVVRVGLLAPIAALFTQLGFNLESVVSKAGFTRISKSATDFYPYLDALAILDLGSRRGGVEQMGLYLGQTDGLASMGEYGDYIATAPTLYRAMLRATALVKWVSPHMSLLLYREGQLLVWETAHSSSEGKHYHHGAFHALAIMIEIVQRAAGPDWVPEEVRVGSPEFTGVSIQQMLGTQIRSVEGQWAFVIPRQILAQPMRPWIRSIDQTTRQSLAATVVAEDLTSSVKALIRSLLATRYANEETFARLCGLSLRAFQRQLAQRDGHRFRELLAQVRFDQARTLLTDEQLPINDVARALGYSEHANFNRAFVRWMGMPPGEYRRHALAGARGGTASGFADVK